MIELKHANLLSRIEEIVNNEYDGHFVVMKFTSNWRVCFGTPSFYNFHHIDIHFMVSGSTLFEALNNLLARHKMSDAEKEKIRKDEEWLRRNREIELDREINSYSYMPYKEYLKTDYWRDRASSMRRGAGYRCQLCNNDKDTLDVHHRTYDSRGTETEHLDLIVLCRACHSKFHNKN